MTWMTGIETRPRATVEDYLALPDDVRAELLDGELVLAPAPHLDHQSVVGAIYFHMHAHVRASRLGRVWGAPVDVHLPTGEVVQPDVLYVSTALRSILVGPHVKGAPDLAVEVLSPSGVLRDRIVKRRAYERSGVKEYWVVDGTSRTVDVYALESDAYGDPLVHQVGHVITSHVLPELRLSVARVFEDLDPA